MSRIAIVRSVFVTLGVGLLVLCSGSVSRAQDPFEIRIEEYEEPALGAFTFEQHVNFVQTGTASAVGSVEPTDHQLRMGSELTTGVSSHIELGFMLLTAVTSGDGLKYAGWRVLPHLYAPDSWHLPVKIGLVAEFSFQRPVFDENAATVDVRPIIEKNFGRAQLDVNPAFGRGLSHSFKKGGWDFEPSFRLAYEVNRRLSPSFEYYGSVGPIRNFSPLNEQLHQIFTGVTLRPAENIQWDLAVGVGLTPAGEKLVYKTRVEFSLGRRAK